MTVFLQQFLIVWLREEVLLAGDPETKSPFIQSLVLPYVEGQWMMLACNCQNIATSTGTPLKFYPLWIGT